MTKKEQLVELIERCQALANEIAMETPDGELEPAIFTIAVLQKGEDGILFSACGQTTQIISALIDVMQHEPTVMHVVKEAFKFHH